MVQAALPDAHAIVVEDDHGLVSYSPPTAWVSKVDKQWYSSGSYHVSREPGASVVFEFEGTAVWFYGDKNFDHGDFQASIDGGIVEISNSKGQPRAALQLLYSAYVEPGKHRLTISKVQDKTPLSIDYFAYLPLTSANSSSSSPLPSPKDKSSFNNSQSSSQGGLAPGVIVGLVMGIFALLLLAVLLFLFWSDRRRKRCEQERARRNLYMQPWMQHGFDASGDRIGSETSWMRDQPTPIQMRQAPPVLSSGYVMSRRPESYISVEPTMTDVVQNEVGDWHRKMPAASGTPAGGASYAASDRDFERYFGSESTSPPASTVPGSTSILTYGRRW